MMPFMDGKRQGFIVAAAATAVIGAGAVYAYFRHKPLSIQWFWQHQINPEIHICNSDTDWHRVESKFLKSSNAIQAVGLDCEWVTRNNQRQPVALLQLSLPTNICILVRLCKFRADKIPESLNEFLMNSSILKIGVGIQADTKYLARDYGLIVQGALDLRYVIDAVPEFSYINQKGLKNLAKEVLGIKLDKSTYLACSDWEAPALSEKQINYAAKDATSSILIFFEILRKSIQKRWFQRLFQKNPSIPEMVQHALQLCDKNVNVNYHQRSSSTTASKSPTRNFMQTQKKDFHTRAYSARSTPLYRNCQLQAPDGEVLCTCDTKKAFWYVTKGLGELISEDPLIVQLKFEPAGRPMYDGYYYVQEKDNMCVVCGKEDSFVRKHVVPHEYRKYFPSVMKDHLSHDVLLLCLNCHQMSNLCDSMMRQKLAEECGAPISTQDGAKVRDDPQLKKVKSAARAIIFSKEKLPSNRLEELTSIIKSYYGVEDLTEDILNKASNAETSIPNKSYIPHGLQVVRHKEKNGGLIAFERSWRQHFLDTMKPKYLPKMWSVDHNHKRLTLAMQNGVNESFDDINPLEFS